MVPEFGNSPNRTVWKTAMHISTSLGLKVEARLGNAPSFTVLRTGHCTCYVTRRWVQRKLHPHFIG